MTAKQSGERAPVVVKKYANRRLYNTATSSYVTLDNLSQMVREGGDFVVYDAKTGEDITRSVLTQIIVEEEQKGGQNLLPISFLRDLIGFYGNSVQWMVPRYLEMAMRSFAQHQEDLVKSSGGPFSNLFPFGQLEELGKQNMAIFEQALKMFAPFAEHGSGSAAAAPPPPPEPDANARALSELTNRLNQLQSQLDALSKKTDAK